MVDSIVDIFLKKKPNVQSVTGIILGREDMTRYKGLGTEELCGLHIRSVPESAMSASFVRRVVGECPKEKFDDIYSSYLDSTEMTKLYDSVKHGLGLPPKVGQKTNKRKNISVAKVKTLKYNYTTVQEENKTILTLSKQDLNLDKEDLSKKQKIIGGKRTRRTTKKHKRKTRKNKKTSKRK